MPRKKFTNQEVFENGEITNQWNKLLEGEDFEGVTEYSILYKDDVYVVSTDWSGIIINPEQRAVVLSDEVN